MNADHPCSRCGRDFADHNYVKDSIVRYVCPVPHVESGYGGFNGGDPRNFHPDGESCTDKEIHAHRLACELWDEAESRGEVPEPEKCPSGWVTLPNGAEAHVLRMPYGIGVYTIEFEQTFEPREVDDEAPEQEA